MNIPLGKWSGSDATQALHETIQENNETASRQTKHIIRLTYAMLTLTIVMIILVAAQIWIATSGKHEPPTNIAPDNSLLGKTPADSAAPMRRPVRTTPGANDGASTASDEPPDGIWEVVSIYEEDCGTWQGTGPDGEDIGGVIWTFTANCRAGDLVRSFTLARNSQYSLAEIELPLRVGDRFQVIQNGNEIKDAETVSLPGGVMLGKLASPPEPMPRQ